MSGIEVAGLALAVFPIVLGLLNRGHQTPEIKKIFKAVAGPEHRECCSRLAHGQIFFIGNLRNLLLPIDNLEDAEIENMLQNPGGEAWKDHNTAQLVKKRLGSEGYHIYLQQMENMMEAVEELKEQLQERLPDPANKGKGIRARAEWVFYNQKFKSQGPEREILLKRVEGCNRRMESLLNVSDSNAKLFEQRNASKRGIVDGALCSVWNQASKLFGALATTWACGCQAQHSTNLLLEHRSSEESDFNVLFEKLGPSERALCRLRITGAPKVTNTTSFTSVTQNSLAVYQPGHRDAKPIKSAMRSKARPSDDSEVSRKMSSFTLTSVEVSSCSAPQGPKPITSLCSSLSQDGGACCGYLPSHAPHYYVFREQMASVEPPDTVSLDQILRKQVHPALERRQRSALAYLLASSFLQLLESPWLPTTWRPSDVVFFRGPGARLVLSQPHLHVRHGPEPSPPPPHTAAAGNDDEASRESLRRRRLQDAVYSLAIVLIELCLDKRLEDQDLWKSAMNGEFRRESHRRRAEVDAAIEWSADINENVGGEYSEAIEWCWYGILAHPQQWRKRMLEKVVRPLAENCRFLSEE